MQDLIDLLQPGQRIFVGGSSNEPAGLLEEMSRQALPDNLHFFQFPIGGMNNVDFTAWRDTYELTTFFMTPALRSADPSRLHYLPMQMRAVFDYLGSVFAELAPTLIHELGIQPPEGSGGCDG